MSSSSSTTHSASTRGVADLQSTTDRLNFAASAFGRFRSGVLDGRPGRDVHESLNQFLVAMGKQPLADYDHFADDSVALPDGGIRAVRRAATYHYANVESNPGISREDLFAQTGAELLETVSVYAFGPRFEQRLDVLARRAVFSPDAFETYSNVMSQLAYAYYGNDGIDRMGDQLHRFAQTSADYVAELESILGDRYDDFVTRMHEQFDELEVALEEGQPGYTATLPDYVDDINSVISDHFPDVAGEVDLIAAAHEKIDDMGRSSNYSFLVAAMPAVYTSFRADLLPSVSVYDQHLASYGSRSIEIARDEVADHAWEAEEARIDAMTPALIIAGGIAASSGLFSAAAQRSAGWDFGQTTGGATGPAVETVAVPAMPAAITPPSSTLASGPRLSSTGGVARAGGNRSSFDAVDAAILTVAAVGIGALAATVPSLLQEPRQALPQPVPSKPPVAPVAPGPVDRYFYNHGGIDDVKAALLLEAPHKKKEIDQMVDALDAGNPKLALKLAKTHLRFRSTSNPNTKDFLRVSAGALVAQAVNSRDAQGGIRDTNGLREGTWTLVWTEGGKARKVAEKTAQVADSVAANGGAGWSTADSRAVTSVVLPSVAAQVAISPKGADRSW